MFDKKKCTILGKKILEHIKTFWFRFDPKLQNRNVCAFVSILLTSQGPLQTLSRLINSLNSLRCEKVLVNCLLQVKKRVLADCRGLESALRGQKSVHRGLEIF